MLNYLFYILGALCLAAGTVLILASFYRLGLRGLYFGDHFGFLFKEKVTSFPYDILDSPQYVGTCLAHFGLSFCYRSPTGVLFTLFYMLCYWILNQVEGRKLKIFYPPTKSDSLKSQ